MLIIDVREVDHIDKALRKYKKKFEKTGVLRQLRSRQAFIKPSIKNRSEVLRAAYRQQVQNKEQD